MPAPRLRLVLILLSSWPVLAAVPLRGEVRLVAPPGYLAGVPLVARVELLNSVSQPDWNRWDAEAILSTDQPGISLSTNRVSLRNGMGTVLLTVQGTGNFVLRAAVGQEQAERSMVSRMGEPVTTVSGGVLPGASTTWTGLVDVTGNVVVPAGHLLTINPGTLVMIRGTAAGTSGVNITVNGTVRSLGTELAPVAITSADETLNWGQVRHSGAQPSLYQYTFISKAGRAPGEGHTGTGPAIRSSNSAVTLEHSVISDLTAGGLTIGKAMMATGSDLVFRHCVFARARMGPEIASTGLLCADSYFMDMTGPDDADGIYLHDSGTQSLTLSRCVLAGGTDDAVDTLDATVTLEDCILRDWPNPSEDAKGVSTFHGEVLLRRCLVVNCFAGVASKSSGPLAVVRLDHCTIVGIEKGVSAATKSNATVGNIQIYLTNSIVRAPDALHSDFGPEKFSAVRFCALSEAWPGTGLLTADPLFVAPASGDFHLQAGSPCIDAGDPAFPLDPNGSRTDIGFFTGLRQGFSVNPHTFIAAGSPWRYLDDGSDQGSAWVNPLFDDSAWKTGPAELGYGDADERTVLQFGPNADDKFRTYYFRQSFLLDDPGRVQSLNLRLLRDDGAIVYLNGREAFRVSMPADAVTYRTFATSASEYGWESAALNTNLVQAGTNLVAVEVHQGNAGSSDLSFDLELTAALTAPTNAPPIVSITAPLPGTILAAPGSMVIEVTAQDPDGIVTNVAFYANDTWLGDDPSSPYTFAWANVPAGEYVLRAVAADVYGLSASSDSVEVVVSGSTAPPRIAGQSPPPGVVSNLVQVEIQFTKAVIGVDAADLLINGTPARAVSGSGESYRFVFLPLPAGTATVQWSPSHGITDTLQPPAPFDHTAPDATWIYDLVDTAPPLVRRLDPVADAVVATLTTLTVTFDEPIGGLDASDLLINSRPALAVTGSGAGPYTFSFSQPPAGPVLVSWSANHAVRDSAGNLFEAAEWLYLRDGNERGLVINEIMYHPASEDPREEFIELHHQGAAPVQLAGWRLTDGVEFVFPHVTIPPGGFLVVAADPDVLRAKYPQVSNVIGPWTGSLSNSREDIRLEDERGVLKDSVTYADEGDWAIRQRGRLDRNHRGWSWLAEHDGQGKSLELINPQLSNGCGHNWQASSLLGGTPGSVNSVFNESIAPLIEAVTHVPVVPRSTDRVQVRARVTGGTGAGRTVEVDYRLDGGGGPFATLPMHDDGQEGDLFARDSVYSALLPAQTNSTVVEFYIRAADALGNVRTWPAPAVASDDGTGPAGQVVNALYQVDDSEQAGTQPLYRIIMTALERAELQAIHDNVNGGVNSDAQMNATFVSQDGTGLELRYLAGVRNRGHGTRGARPSNFRVNFRSDAEWQGGLALNLNAQLSWLQVLGAAVNLQSGIAGAYSRPVQLRVNNVNPALNGALDRTFGSYAANEPIDADWADHHFPTDGEGNVYRAIRDLAPPAFDYRPVEVYPTLSGGEDKRSYTNTWFKNTNASEDDWTDLIGMLRVLGPSGTEPFTPENVRRVIDVEQWLRHLAVMNLLGNSETGLNGGYNDDYFMYRGIQRPQFILMYYDLDQILGYGGSFRPDASLLSATNNQGAGRALERLLRHPEFEPIYFQTLAELIDTSFSAAEFDPLVDQVLGDFVPELSRNQVKSWMEARRAFVRSQLPVPLPGKPPRAVLSAPPRSPTPRPTAAFHVSGEGVTHYRYSFNGGVLSPESSVSTPLTLSGLTDGPQTLTVIGRNAAGVFEPIATAPQVAWVIDSTWPAVRINEAAARRSGNLRDQIELYNEGSVSLNLAGMRLTDDPAEPNKYVFNSVILSAGGYLTLDSEQLGFALDASGEGVFLFQAQAAGGALLDSVVFGQQITDLSIGRIGENGEWQLAQPTLGAANQPHPLGSAAAVRINEWLTSPLSPFSADFIELFNPDARPVSIGGAWLSDRPIGAPRMFPITPLTFLPPNGYAVFQTGDGSRAGDISFGLATEQGQIALTAADGSLIDSVLYGPQRLGISSGRCPDGAAHQRILDTPTPGAANDCPFVPPPPQSVVVVPFSHVWKYDASGADLGAAWKEPSYDDSSWAAGPALLGFENTPLAEPLLTPFSNPGFTTFYFRTSFALDPALVPSSLLITHLIDDGAAFYLNGQEISPRFNLAADAGFQTFASATVGNAGYETLPVPANALRPGTNLLAVEVHQRDPGSSDMVFGLRLDAIAEASTAVEAGVLINEVLAHSASLEPSRAGWVELFNPSAAPVDLAGMSLSDDPTNPAPWTFPAGVVLGPKGFLKIAFDAGQPASVSNTGFGLQAGGGALYLWQSAAKGGDVLSSVSFGIQAVDWSIGRVPDGSGHWVLAAPTPASANVSAVLGDARVLRINEWMADPTTGPDWFELYNPSAHPVDLSGLRLSDELDESGSILPPLSFMAGGSRGFQKFEADESLAAGADHVHFRLSAAGESLLLSAVNGVIIDGVRFSSQTAGVSQGRLPDGTAQIVAFPGSPSPGASNYLLASDRDGDGLPDDWESAGGLNPDNPADALLDKDGDGFANLEEYLAGTDPANAADYLAMQVEPASTGVTIRFRTVPGRTYQLEYSANLGSANWAVLAAFPAADSAVAWVADPNPGGRRFYRLRVVANQ